MILSAKKNFSNIVSVRRALWDQWGILVIRTCKSEITFGPYGNLSHLYRDFKKVTKKIVEEIS